MTQSLPNIVLYGALGIIIIGLVYLLDRKIGLAIAVLVMLGLLALNLRGAK